MVIVKIDDKTLEETKEVKARFYKEDLLKAEAELSTRLEEIRAMLKLFD